MYDQIIEFIKTLYTNQEFIPLHAPVFQGNEKKYVDDCIDSTFVSSVGAYVTKFEQLVCDYTGSKYAIATTNGTSALHMALVISGVDSESEVLCQSLTFVATANAVSYTGAQPIFIDSATDNLGMCPVVLEKFLSENTEKNSDHAINKKTKKRISACIPMHVFGNPVDMDEILRICEAYKIPVIEDAAESLGSFYKKHHTGTLGEIGILSFNGNKIATCGGGGMILTANEKLAKKAKHLTTTAKRPHKWEFYHDEIGYNYRLPNINAALGCAQMETLPMFVENKRQTAQEYKKFFSKLNVRFVDESKDTKSNFWLNAIQLENRKERDKFLDYSNTQGVMSRPIWALMSDLPAFSRCQKTNLMNAERYVDTIVNLPSSIRITK